MLYFIFFMIALLETSRSQNPSFASSNYDFYSPPLSRYGLYNPHRKSQIASTVDRQTELNEELDDLSSETDWTQWTEWSFCSRSCGGGVSMRTRRCGLRTLTDIMNECSGNDIQHRICNTQSCANDEDFRSYQCARYNHRRVFTSTQFEWTAYYGAISDPCQLTCMAVGYNFYKEFGPVKDGTKCFRHKHDICIEGKCLKVGCDQVVGSNLTEDSCGVCGGDNSGCYYYSSLFTKLPRSAAGFSYHEVIVIPAGATRIHVVDESSNYLALMEDVASHQDYIVNGNWVISWPGDVMAAGTVVKYARNDKIETIDIPGPTSNNLHVMILYLGGKVSIEYEYWAATGARPKQYSALEEVEVTQDEVVNSDYYDSLYDDWDVMATSTSTTSTSKTSTSTTATTRAPTTSTTEAFLPTLPTTHRRMITDKKKRKSTKPGFCTPCKKPRSKKKHFCSSDFVIHVRILSKNKLEGHRYRHDISVFSTFKSDFTLMKREYLWVYSNCCPKLRPYKQYLIMGRKRKVKIGSDGRSVFRYMHNGTLTSSRGIPRYETRLVVDYMDYWRLWKKKYETGMNKLANKIKCGSFNSIRPPIGDRDPEKKSTDQKTTRTRH